MDVRFRSLDRWPLPNTPADKRRGRYTFRTHWTDTLALLEKELGYLGARDVVIETGHRPGDIRLDGWPRADAREPGHPGVAISFESKQGPLRFLTDTHESWRHNVHAIALGLQALRAVDRYGITHRAEQYKGWAAIPQSTTTGNGAVELLGQVAGIQVATDLGPDATRSLYKRALLKAHPDHGGSRELLDEVQDAGRRLGVA